MKKLLIGATLVALMLLSPGTAHAVPLLQLYMEGAQYDYTTESWVFMPSGNPNEKMRLWTMGNISGPGGKGPISDVKLSASYTSTDFPSDLTITLTPSLAGGTGVYKGFVDGEDYPPGVPEIASTWQEFGVIDTSAGPWTVGPVVTNGSAPVLSDGKNLPWHGTFGEDIFWQEFYLGDFDSPDSQVADFIGSLPSAPNPQDLAGQLKVYEVSFLPSGGVVHFDLYNHYGANKRARFAPFSHDVHVLPEPASFIVWFLIGLSWAGSAWRYQYRRRWNKWQQEEAAGAARIHGDDQAGRFTDSGDQLEEQVGIRPAGRWATHRPSR